MKRYYYMVTIGDRPTSGVLIQDYADANTRKEADAKIGARYADRTAKVSICPMEKSLEEQGWMPGAKYMDLTGDNQ